MSRDTRSSADYPDDYPETPEEFAEQIKPVLTHLGRLAVAVGMISTAQMLEHVAKLADEEATTNAAQN